MSETMHIENMFVNHAKIRDKALTWVEYTQASGLPDWVGVITGELISSSVPNISNVKTIYIGNSVTSIGDGAFKQRSNLTSVTIQNGIKKIGYEVFMSCNGLTSITIPDSVTNISARGIGVCSGLTIIKIGSGITEIENYAFAGDQNCLVFDFRKAQSVPALHNVNAFNSTPSNKEIIVPDSLYDSWRAASNWSSSTNNIVNCIVKASQSSLGPLT